MHNQQIKKPKHSDYIKDLVLLFAIPAGVILFAAMIMSLPRLWANPQYDFIYSACMKYSCNVDYKVNTSGNIIQYGKKNDGNNFSDLLYYSAKENSVIKIDLKEYKNSRLNTSTKSPDGYSLVRRAGNPGTLFFEGHPPTFYLQKGVKKKEIKPSIFFWPVKGIKFLGWVNK